MFVRKRRKENLLRMTYEHEVDSEWGIFVGRKTRIDAQQLHWSRIRMNTRRPKDRVLTYVIKDHLRKQ
ncbi:hypothetical protein MRX96_046940 [Rhipicephalus microplus]